MQRQSVKKQTVLLTLTNALVRALGFIMRIIFSRLMGAQAIGIMELASSAHMFAIAPVTAGLPLAVSRLTAQTDEKQSLTILSAGYALIKKIALIIMPLMLLSSVYIARLLGDERTFPSIIASIPCIWVLGISGVINGYCYGRSNATYPALSELFEQIIRFSLAIMLLFSLSNLSLAWFAAIPSFATTIAELTGLLIIHRMAKLPRLPKPSMDTQKKLFQLALPQSLIRLCNTGLRTLNAVLIPLRLRVSGLVFAEATARFGMLNGMVMPLIMLPSVATSALAMVCAPKMAALENDFIRLKRTIFRFVVLAGTIGVSCATLIFFIAPFVSRSIYRIPELCGLIRFMCPAVIFTSLNQVMSGMIAGVGRQKHAFWGTVLSACASAISCYIFTAKPDLGIFGAALSTLIGQCINLTWSIVLIVQTLYRAKKRSVS